MKKEFDWNKFKTEEIVVHCKTQKEADRFFHEMNLQGIPDTNITEIDTNFWDVYKEDTCYSFYMNDWRYADKNLYERLKCSTVVEFSDYFNTYSCAPNYGEIKINGDCFIIKERDECSNAEWMYLCDLFGLDYDATERIVIDGIVKYFGLRKDEV